MTRLVTFAAFVSLVTAACGEVPASTPDASIAPPPDACVPETDDALCTRLAACEQGAHVDNCGVSRSLDCGACGAALGCVHGTCKTPECSVLKFNGAKFPDI